MSEIVVDRADRRRGDAADSFTVRGVTFVCWLIENGQRYEWRAFDGAIGAGRETGLATFYARRNDYRIRGGFEALRDAMECAAKAHQVALIKQQMEAA